jgi:hypothetical protein
MKLLYLICAGLLLLGLTALPIGYYTMLRILVTITSVMIVVQQLKNGVGLWVIIFGFIAILFNPIIPVYLNSKAAWRPIDITCAILFIIKAFISKNNNNSLVIKP